jgi:DoxX-like family
MERQTIRRVHYGSLFLFSLIMIAGGVADLIPVPSNVAIFIHLGYPLYVLAMIGVAKLLGALAILYGRPLALKEWAYAGFTFDLVGALISHAVMGNRPQLIFPALLLILLIVSYVAWKRSVPSAARNERLET